MRILRVIAVTFLVITFVTGGFWLLLTMSESSYLRLQHKSPKYYAELAAACDSILATHPIGTNEVIWIPVTDTSLPAVVRRLHPLKLQVNPHGVWILLDSDSRAGTALVWQPKWDDTNVWKLDVLADAPEVDLYSVKR
jgi:hypothetical protein